jgi:hypothetical protein
VTAVAREPDGQVGAANDGDEQQQRGGVISALDRARRVDELAEFLMGRFDGKVVLVTGGARGQGRLHAIEFAKATPTSSWPTSPGRSRPFPDVRAVAPREPAYTRSRRAA